MKRTMVTNTQHLPMANIYLSTFDNIDESVMWILALFFSQCKVLEPAIQSWSRQVYLLQVLHLF